MRILQLHNHHASLGGAMEVLEFEGQLLRSAGHEVEQFTLPPTEQLGLSGPRAALKAVWNRETARDVGDRIDQFEPDVVHVHTPFPLMSPAVFRVADGRGVPNITTVHSFRYSCIAGTCYRDGAVCEDCIGSRSKFAGLRHRCYHDSLGASGALTASLGLHRALGTFSRSIDRFVALTPFAKRMLERDGIPAERIVVKANTVMDPGRAIPAQVPEPYVAFAGRLIEIKGVRTLLEAWRNRPAGIRLRIAGDGDLRALVEEHAASDSSIEYVGWIDGDAIPELFGKATAVLVPSEWYEGQPLVTIRSLSVGTPVITSDLENLCEDALNDGAGMAFRTGDAQHLAEVLGTLVTDRAGWVARAEAARRSYLSRHAPEVTVRALERIYADVIAERRSSVTS